MAYLEKDYEECFETLAPKVDVIIRECLGAYESVLEKTELKQDGSDICFWTGTCVYFGGRVVSLFVVLTDRGESRKLMVHSTPGLSAAGVDGKVIRKICEKLARSGL